MLLFITDESSYRKLAWVAWTHNHWIPFRSCNRLSYQAMFSTRSQSQLCTATPISSLFPVVTFHIGLWLRQSPHLRIYIFLDIYGIYINRIAEIELSKMTTIKSLKYCFQICQEYIAYFTNPFHKIYWPAGIAEKAADNTPVENT